MTFLLHGMPVHPPEPIIARGLGPREGGGATPTLDFPLSSDDLYPLRIAMSRHYEILFIPVFNIDCHSSQKFRDKISHILEREVGVNSEHYVNGDIGLIKPLYQVITSNYQYQIITGMGFSIYLSYTYYQKSIWDREHGNINC